MKKKLMTIMMGILLMVVLVACAKNYKVGKNGEVYNDTVKINQYKGLEVEVQEMEVPEVTDADVEDSIPSDLQTLCLETEEVFVNRPAQLGDTIILDFVGKMDGEAFTGGTASDQLLELGSGSMIPGFEDAIVGHNIGEVFDINVTFPETYAPNPDFAGKPAVFTITLDGILPELTDEIAAKLNPNVATVDEYKAEAKKALEKSNKESTDAYNKQQLQSAVYAALLEQCVVSDYPEDELEESIEDATEYYTSMAEYYGTTLEELTATYGIDIEDEAKAPLRFKYAVQLIAEVEKIEVTDELYKEKLTQYAEKQGLTEAQMEEEYGEEDIRAAIIEELVMDFLVENCKQVEPETETQTETE